MRIGKFWVTLLPAKLEQAWGYEEIIIYPFPTIKLFGLGPLVVFTWQ